MFGNLFTSDSTSPYQAGSILTVLILVFSPDICLIWGTQNTITRTIVFSD